MNPNPLNRGNASKPKEETPLLCWSKKTQDEFLFLLGQDPRRTPDQIAVLLDRENGATLLRNTIANDYNFWQRIKTLQLGNARILQSVAMSLAYQALDADSEEGQGLTILEKLTAIERAKKICSFDQGREDQIAMNASLPSTDVKQLEEQPQFQSFGMVFSDPIELPEGDDDEEESIRDQEV